MSACLKFFRVQYSPSENRILDTRITLLRVTLKCQIKKHGEGRERRIFTQFGICCGKRQISTQLIFSHLQAIDMRYRCK
jgi:hypothetical protein